MNTHVYFQVLSGRWNFVAYLTFICSASPFSIQFCNFNFSFFEDQLEKFTYFTICTYNDKWNNNFLVNLQFHQSLNIIFFQSLNPLNVGNKARLREIKIWISWEDYFELCSVVYPQSPSVHPRLPQEGHQPHPHCGLYQGSHPRPEEKLNVPPDFTFYLCLSYIICLSINLRRVYIYFSNANLKNSLLYKLGKEV